MIVNDSQQLSNTTCGQNWSFPMFSIETMEKNDVLVLKLSMKWYICWIFDNSITLTKK